MEKFLSTCKKNLDNLDSFAKVHVVLGNESCDLDSAVSTIVTAYLLHELQPVSNVLVLPVLNVCKKDIKLRTEITYFFEQVDLSFDIMVYRDDIDLKKLHSQNKLSLTLVDHNLLPQEDAELQCAVKEIIDHHRLETSHRCDKTVEMVGSCSTLVAEKVLHSKADLIDPQIALLLFGTILLDTVCLSESARKATPKDRNVISKLQELLPEVTQEEVFKSLQTSKNNVSGLTLDELLRRDLKAVSTATKHIAISSIPGEIKSLGQQNGIEGKLGQFCKDHGYNALVVLSVKRDEKCNGVQRGLAVFSYDVLLRQQITSALMAVAEPCLELELCGLSTDNFISFAQKNCHASRKVVLPVIRKFLLSLEDNVLPKASDQPVTNGIPSGERLTMASNQSPDDFTLSEQPLSPQNSSSSASETAKDGGAEKHEDSSVLADPFPEHPSLYKAQTVDFPECPQHTKSGQTRLGSVGLDDDTDDDILSRGDQPSISEMKRERPSTLSGGDGRKRKIKVNPDILHSSIGFDDDQKSLSSISNRSDCGVSSPVDGLSTPDIDTPDEMDDSVLERDDSTLSEPIPELSAMEEFQEERSWRTCTVGGLERKVDMKVIEPYKKVLSHGGYFGEDRHAIIVFSACYLPDRSRKDYDYVMDNLFLYVLTTLDQLVAEDYVLIYLHGATERSAMPSFGWLKRCYQMIDRRLRKNLKGLYLVHPTFWVKTIVIMTRPFISSKFYRKLAFVNSLEELGGLVPMEYVCIPDKVKQFDAERLLEG
uniref:Putative exopolyphosphatase n=1 Tax=Ornithodoros turicata TaxID=34597 RepID=A0A2R5LCJ1_9ACAR